VTIVDARGLACPLPLTMAKRKMAQVQPGEALILLTTDREAPIDLAAWAADEGHHYEQREQEGWFELVVRKAAVSAGA
jgi:tRNA 2-thiouridine synthesizing protein A